MAKYAFFFSYTARAGNDRVVTRTPATRSALGKDKIDDR